MSGPDINELLKQAQNVQQKIGEVQEQLARRRFEASAGGGMVTAVVSGGLRVIELRMEPGLVSDADIDMLQDLTAAAVNAAIEKAQLSVQQEMQRLQGSFGLPGMPGPQGTD
jgi:DNA-binding YbaB/EbfC family protein